MAAATPPSVPVMPIGESAAQPRRNMVPIVGGVVAVLVLGGAGMMLMRRGDSSPPAAADTTRTPSQAVATPPTAPTSRDSISATSATDSAAAAAAAAAASGAGWIRISGDLPVDAVVWLDGAPRRGRIVQAPAGDHVIEIETGEFQPWDTTVSVRAGDTLRLRVELILKPDSTLR